MNRRNFLKAGGGLAFSFSAASYNRILGSNGRLNVATAGLNGRGMAHLSMARTLKSQLNIIGLIDPDANTIERALKSYADICTPATLKYADVRQALENKDLDVLTIAAPDHWHMPMALMALQAGKHVYCEKPCAQNPYETVLFQKAVEKYGQKVQIGNQQRSAPTSILLRDLIAQGVIGNAYYAKTWYEANRGTIGTGKKTEVPSNLNWDLWQGPAPLKDYKDNWVHYNWHWFKHWGTGEIVNNGLHEIDVARVMLGVGLPNKVSSSGGRFAFKDDWEFYDTQNVSYEFDGGKMISWEGKSCNGTDVHKRPGGRGTWIYGTDGTAVVDRGGFTIFDKKNKIIRTETEANSKSSVDTLGITGLDNYHMENFLKAITENAALNSPIQEAVKTTLMCHYGNISQQLGKTLSIDTFSGKINDKEAMKLWKREYRKGWEPKV